MLYRAWVQINFDSGHAPVENPCPNTSGPHGHRYSVRVYVERDYEPKRLDISEVRQALFGIREELQGTVIDTMLPGVDTSPSGIGVWVLERLASYRGVEAVRVSMEPDEWVEVHR